MSNQQPKLIRKTAPVISSGFRIGMGDSFAIVDFIDSPDEESRNIFFSIGLTKKQARSLAEQLSEFAESEE
tara:strand:- start:1192 stop:1404 length:213 start_codon:yes stop_codon:yes gene_type:complete